MAGVKKAKKILIEENDEIINTKNKSVFTYFLLFLPLVLIVILFILQNIQQNNVYTDESCFITESSVIVGFSPTCNEKNIKIPKEINGVKITEIGERAFSEMGIESVEFPDTLKKIGKYSFSRNNLTEVTIPDSVTKVYAGAFEQNEITSVVFGENVKLIGSWSFAWNYLTEVEIPDSVKTINMQAFDCNSLTKVIIGRNVETIEYVAFGQDDTCDLLSSEEEGNRNLSHIINKSGRSFDWYDVLGHDNSYMGPELWLVSGEVETKYGTITITEK